MQLRPILSTLRRHKLTAGLLMLQVAFTCAIVCNVVFMVAQRVQRVSVPTGLAETELSIIHSSGFAGTENAQARHATDLAALRALGGVRSAAAVSYSLPLSQGDSSYGVCPDAASMARAMQQRSAKGTSPPSTSANSSSSGSRVPRISRSRPPPCASRVVQASKALPVCARAGAPGG